jgi:hypothetical protein
MVYSSDGSEIKGKQYAFPSVTVNERVIGPSNVNPAWRNTIGVAGVFTRGPLNAKITSKQQFISLYGEDDSSGSLAVAQAFNQGATNFQIARVLPGFNSASGTISFQDGSYPLSTEAVVGTGSSRTVGLVLSVEGVNAPVKAPGSFIGYEQLSTGISREVVISSATTGSLDFDYKGRGQFSFSVLRAYDLAEANSATTYTVTLDTATANQIQLVTYAYTGGVDALETAVKVGYRVTSGSSIATIMTPVFEVEEGVRGFYIKGDATAGVGTTSITISKPVATDEYYVLGYIFEGADGASLSEVIGNKEYIGYGRYLGFITVSSTQTSAFAFSLMTETGTTAVDGFYEEAATNITLKFGSSNLVETVNLIPSPSNSVFRVSFINSSVEIGATDNSVPNFATSEAAFKGGTSSLAILQRLRAAILQSADLGALIDAVDINDAYLPYSLSFKLQTAGAAGNKITYKLDRVASAGTPTDINYEGSSGTLFGVVQNMVGGEDGARPSELYLYDDASTPLVYIQALSVGSAGNNIKVTVKPRTNGEFGLEVSYLNNSLSETRIPSESYVLNSNTVELKSGLYPETIDSNLIRAYFIPALNAQGRAINPTFFSRVPTRTAPANNSLVGSTDLSNPGHPQRRGAPYLENIKLGNGYEPAFDINNPPEEAIIAAVNGLAEKDVAFLMVPSVIAGDIRYQKVITAVLNQIDSATPYNGLRFAVLQTPPRLSTGKAEMLALTYSNRKLILVSGHVSPASKAYLGVNTVSAVGVYAGVLASTSPQISPAAVTGVSGVTSVDTPSSLEFLDSITRSRIEAIHLDPVVNVIKFLNGRTSSNDINYKWVSVNRTSDHLVMQLFKNLQWARSQPNTNDLRNKVASGCDAFLESSRIAGLIQSFTPTICSEQNNTTEDVARGRLNVAINYIPIFPADYINVNLTRTFTNEFSINLN